MTGPGRCIMIGMGCVMGLVNLGNGGATKDTATSGSWADTLPFSPDHAQGQRAYRVLGEGETQGSH